MNELTKALRELRERCIMYGQQTHPMHPETAHALNVDLVHDIEQAIAISERTLSDEEIERIAREHAATFTNGEDVESIVCGWFGAWRYARDNFGLGSPGKGLSVDEVMNIVREFLESREVIVMRNIGGPYPGDAVWLDLRARLEAATKA